MTAIESLSLLRMHLELSEEHLQVRNPQPSTLNPQPSTLNPQPSTGLIRAPLIAFHLPKIQSLEPCTPSFLLDVPGTGAV